MEVVASIAANLPYAELEASPVSPPNWAGPTRALYTMITIAYTNWEAFEKNCPGGNLGALFVLIIKRCRRSNVDPLGV